MADILYSIDLTIFYFFNHTLSVPALDKFFTLITSVENWYIAYVILLLTCFIKGGIKGKIAVISVILLIVITDQVSHNILKELIQRIRPCNALPDVNTPAGCSGTLSFPSNHAVNNFAAATFFYRLYPDLKWALFVSAAIVAISRVYLGMHYPSDVLGGAILGMAAGYLFSKGSLLLTDYINKRNEQPGNPIT